MVLSLVLIIATVLVLMVWAVFGFKTTQNKIISFLLIGLIIFSFVSFNMAVGENVSISNFSDLKNVGKIYFSWLGNAVNNIKIITAQAIKLDWKGNTSA